LFAVLAFAGYQVRGGLLLAVYASRNGSMLKIIPCIKRFLKTCGNGPAIVVGRAHGARGF